MERRKRPSVYAKVRKRSSYSIPKRRVEVSEESRPAVFEVLCDECETALNFEEFEDALRKEVLLTLGAR